MSTADDAAPAAKQQRHLSADCVSSAPRPATDADPTQGLGGPRDARDAGVVRGRDKRSSRGREWWLNRKRGKKRNRDGDGDEAAASSSSSSSSSTRFPKRKVALLFCYSGKGYMGLQKNPGVKTIEDELENALVLTGCIPQDCVGNLQKIQWQRCARTDKGVGALFQIVSLKLVMPAAADELVQRLNQYLPPSIRMLAIERVSKSFNAKLACHARTYEYMLPTACLLSDKTGPVFDDGVRAKVQRVLDQFLGSHKFHNFTSGRPWWLESSRRTILSYTCSAPEVVDGIEFVTLTVKGNSFVLHQIRKMTALVVVMVRDDAPLQLVEAVFQPHPVCIHMAPAVGLMLRQTHFDQFFDNPDMRHLRGLAFPELQPRIEAFKRDYLLPEMCRQIRDDGEFDEWLRTIASFPLDYQHIIDTSTLPPPPLPPKEVQQKKRDKLVSDSGGHAVREKRSDNYAKKTYRAINPGWTNDSFAPVLHGQSLNYHFGRIYKGSITVLNNALRTSPLKQHTVRSLYYLPASSDLAPAVRNAAGDVYAHQLFWTSVMPRPAGADQPPDNQLVALVAQQFGSFDQFRALFTDRALAHFGSGWIWLCVDPSASSDAPLVIVNTQDSDLPAEHMVPLLNLDLWEHAYYADFRNDRQRYVNEFWWPFADWTRGNERLQRHLRGEAEPSYTDADDSAPVQDDHNIHVEATNNRIDETINVGETNNHIDETINVEATNNHIDETINVGEANNHIDETTNVDATHINDTTNVEGNSALDDE